MNEINWQVLELILAVCIVAISVVPVIAAKSAWKKFDDINDLERGGFRNE